MANEKRLIDANALLATLEKIADEDETPFFHLDEIADEIMDAPTVDAVEVVHGKWMLEQDYGDGTADYKCSNCEYDDNFFTKTLEIYIKYCPYCGAKMDGGNEDD